MRLTLPIPFAEFITETEDTTINAEDTTINAEDTTINTEDTTINAEDTTINTDDTTINAEDTTINTATKTIDIILSLIKQNPKITTKELAFLCGMTKDGVYYHIKKPKGKGYIVRDEAKQFQNCDEQNKNTQTKNNRVCQIILPLLTLCIKSG